MQNKGFHEKKLALTCLVPLSVLSYYLGRCIVMEDANDNISMGLYWCCSSKGKRKSPKLFSRI
jgi:hypothetical protein